MSSEIQILLEMTKENNDSLGKIRKSMHDLVDTLHGVQGRVELIGNDLKNEQIRSQAAFKGIEDSLGKQEKEIREIENQVISISKDVETVQRDLSSYEDLKKKISWTILSVILLGVLTSLGLKL